MLRSVPTDKSRLSLPDTVTIPGLVAVDVVTMDHDHVARRLVRHGEWCARGPDLGGAGWILSR